MGRYGRVLSRIGVVIVISKLGQFCDCIVFVYSQFSSLSVISFYLRVYALQFWHKLQYSKRQIDTH